MVRGNNNNNNSNAYLHQRSVSMDGGGSLTSHAVATHRRHNSTSGSASSINNGLQASFKIRGCQLCDDHDEPPMIVEDEDYEDDVECGVDDEDVLSYQDDDEDEDYQNDQNMMLQNNGQVDGDRGNHQVMVNGHHHQQHDHENSFSPPRNDRQQYQVRLDPSHGESEDLVAQKIINKIYERISMGSVQVHRSSPMSTIDEIPVQNGKDLRFFLLLISSKFLFQAPRWSIE